MVRDATKRTGSVQTVTAFYTAKSSEHNATRVCCVHVKYVDGRPVSNKTYAYPKRIFEPLTKCREPEVP
jgi:hypothetical protein